jgi:hypothetical protein
MRNGRRVPWRVRTDKDKSPLEAVGIPQEESLSLDFQPAPGILWPTAGRARDSIGGKREDFKG